MNMGTEFWAAHVAAAKLEAIPASEYARRHDLSVKSLYYWRRKLTRDDEIGAPVHASKFVALHIAAGGSHSSNCTLALPSGLRLEMPVLPSVEWLTRLARSLQGAR